MIYEYECDSCGHKGELDLSMKASTRNRKCPVCGKVSFVRLVTGGGGTIFKGGGWGSKKPRANDTNLSDIANHEKFRR